MRHTIDLCNGLWYYLYSQFAIHRRKIMNKSQLIAKITEDTGLKKADAEKFLDAFMATVKEVWTTGDKLQIAGFGTFETRERAAKTGVNPATGAKIEIAACKVPAFKPGKSVKDELNAD